MRRGGAPPILMGVEAGCSAAWPVLLSRSVPRIIAADWQWDETVNRKKAQNRPFLHGRPLPSPRSPTTFFLLRTTQPLSIFEMVLLFFHLSRSFSRNRHVHFWAQVTKHPPRHPPPFSTHAAGFSKSKRTISWLLRLLHICERKKG